MATAYAYDGCQYSLEQFQAYYGSSEAAMWAIATQVTQDIYLLTEQLVRKQHQLTLNVHLHECFEDALLVVVSWCHGQFGAVVGKGGATEPVDIFAALAQSLLKPLYWRASVLWTAGKEITSTEPLSPDIRDSAWESWQRNFAHFERRPGQEKKSWKEMRSIFYLAVNRDTGCVHLAKAIILFSWAKHSGSNTHAGVRSQTRPVAPKPHP